MCERERGGGRKNTTQHFEYQTTRTCFLSWYHRESTKVFGRNFHPLLATERQAGKLLDCCLSEAKVQSDCFLISPRELHCLWAFMFCRKWKRIERDYFPCAGLRSTKNSFWVNLTTSHFLSGQQIPANSLKREREREMQPCHARLSKKGPGMTCNLLWVPKCFFLGNSPSSSHPAGISLASSTFCSLGRLPTLQLNLLFWDICLSSTPQCTKVSKGVWWLHL